MNVLSWSNVLKFPPASYFFRSFLHRTVCIFCSTCFGCLYLPPLLSLTHLHQQVLELLCVVNHLLECIIKLEYLIFTYEKSFTIYQKIKIFQVNATRTQKKREEDHRKVYARHGSNKTGRWYADSKIFKRIEQVAIRGPEQQRQKCM